MRSKSFQTFIVIVMLGGFFYPFLGRIFRGPPWTYFAGLIVLAAGVALIARSSRARQSGTSGGMRTWLTSSDEFLCDSCKYDNVRDCSRPDRPNARTCPDYKQR